VEVDFYTPVWAAPAQAPGSICFRICGAGLERLLNKPPVYGKFLERK